jgi:energy-coupling factor transporter transmembrane protein EcfT
VTRTGLLRRVPALVKLGFMLSLTVALFSRNVRILAASAALVVLSALAARLGVKTWLSVLKTACMYGAFIALFRIIGKPLERAVLITELSATGDYLFRLTCILLAGTVFYATTGMTELTLALSAIQRKLPWNDRVSDIALLLSLTVGFVPRILDTWKTLELSWNARGGACRKGLSGSFRRMTTLVPLLIIRLLAVASDTDRAIRNRSAFLPIFIDKHHQ